MKMIICTNLPFYFVKNPFFTEYARFLNPGCIPTTQNTGRGFLINDYDDFQFSNLLNPIKVLFIS